jgi:hypothetical protein
MAVNVQMTIGELDAGTFAPLRSLHFPYCGFVAVAGGSPATRNPLDYA